MTSRPSLSQPAWREMLLLAAAAGALFLLGLLLPLEALPGPLPAAIQLRLLYALSLALLFACAGLILSAGRRRREAEQLRKQMQQVKSQAHRLANFDSLTGLPNRPLCLDRLQQALAEARRNEGLLAVVLLDLDGFQSVNDSLGPAAGDRLLAAFAERLAGYVRQSETFGRLADDEFLFLLTSIQHENDAAAFARRLQEGLSTPLVLDGHSFPCSACIGIAIYPWDGDDTDGLLRSAAVALSNAKSRGKGRLQFFGNRLNLLARERFQLETGLREALQRDQLVLYYQPQVSLSDGRIVGAEALMRWQHPVRGLISPSKFIQVAEDSGLIGAIGEWTLREACRQVRLWHLLGFEQITIGVNISAQQFTSADFPRLVQELLREHRLAPEALEIELTESGLIRDLEQAQSVLVRLGEMGVALALDDFGTGFSSLRYLQSLRFQRLKIDQSFIQTMMTDASGQKIVLATIALARELGMEVVAEGVEEWEQLQFLRQHQCQTFQGYLFSPPVPAGQLTRMLQSSSALDLSFPYALGEPSPEDFGLVRQPPVQTS